jgi:ring-1,2-phenylacetyl-CoA epoxidase subunit PaaC
MSDDHVYLSLAQQHEDTDARWAFGTGFEDPLHGVSTELPARVDPVRLADLCVALGDDALVSAQRLAQWCTRAPELEEEVALANIGLDLLGQARLLYSRAGQVDETGRSEDAYAYLRAADEFRNVRLAELPNGDFAFSMARLLVLSCWRLAVFAQLAGSADPVLSAIAEKGVKELTYHRQYAAEWTVRLGDGTALSRERMSAALEQVLPYLEELFAACDGLTVTVDSDLDGAVVRDEVTRLLDQVSQAAGLRLPAVEQAPGHGRDGGHTEHLGPLITELQYVARALPGAIW